MNSEFKRFNHLSEHLETYSSSLDKDLTLNHSTVNTPNSEGDPVILHLFTVDNQGLLDAKVTLDLNGSEDIQLENGTEELS